jgi:outer membrane protein
MKKVGGLILSLGVLLITGIFLFNDFSGAAAASVTIGYVDMEQLRKELPDFQNLQQTIKDKESEFNLFRGYIYQEHQTAIKDLEKRTAQEKSGKSAAVQAELDKKQQNEIKKKTEELNARLSDKLAEIQGYLRKQEQAVQDKVDQLIKEVASEKKVSVVLDKKVVYHGGKDLTKEVIEAAKNSQKK